jgi:ABC-type Zn uptake system ZnuABC Zn-binding protein ZnuA
MKRLFVLSIIGLSLAATGCGNKEKETESQTGEPTTIVTDSIPQEENDSVVPATNDTLAETK